MIISEAKFIASYDNYKKCPKQSFPEYAFIGRSNVGKSSMINMLAGNKSLAKISSTPGKTRIINYFLINQCWHLVDLPGYGYAKISKENREKFRVMIEEYILHRENLVCLFVLIDSRIPAQRIDIEFMTWLGDKQVPFVILFTKCDKLSKTQLHKSIENYRKELFKQWEELPELFITSSEKIVGKDEILKFIEDTNKTVNIVPSKKD